MLDQRAADPVAVHGRRDEQAADRIIEQADETDRLASPTRDPCFRLGQINRFDQRALIEAVYLPKAETWVACRAGEPVGFIGLLDDSIGGLFVAPAMHGHGIGRALVEHALALKGALDLEVYADNLDARAFYARLGFDEISRRDGDDEGLPFVNILMRSTR